MQPPTMQPQLFKLLLCSQLLPTMCAMQPPTAIPPTMQPPTLQPPTLQPPTLRLHTMQPPAMHGILGSPCNVDPPWEPWDLLLEVAGATLSSYQTCYYVTSYYVNSYLQPPCDVIS